jgi:hypothetical protein
MHQYDDQHAAPGVVEHPVKTITPATASTIPTGRAVRDRVDIRTECAGVIACALSRVLPGEVGT